jgi:hypothetical protein
MNKGVKTIIDPVKDMARARIITDVGGGRLVASLRDADGNIIGLIQDA